MRDDQTPVRSACEANAAVIAHLPAGTPVEIRFRLADGSDCIKIQTSAAGKDIIGYVAGSALRGLEGFEYERSSAAPAGPASAPAPLETATRKAVAQNNGDPVLARASDYLAANQPEQALGVLEPALPKYRNNANVLLLAGLAAYRVDNLDSALEYWKESLDLAPNDSLAGVYERVKREAATDQPSEKLYGMHIVLRYGREAVPIDSARGILSVLDEEFARISSALGCSSGERIVAIVQDRDTYLRSTGAAEWSGGWYDGRIHIAWTNEKAVGPQMRRGLAHELVHACLTSIPSGDTPWPTWLQEGLAQKLSGDTVDPAARDQLRHAAQAHQIPRLEQLHPDWSSMSIADAREAYNLALAAADALYENYSTDGVRNLVKNPGTLPKITAELDKYLGF